MSNKRKPPSVSKSMGGIKMKITSVVHRIDPEMKCIQEAAALVTEAAIENAVRSRIVTKTLGQMLRSKMREAPKEDHIVERLRVVFHGDTLPEVILANAAVGVFNNYSNAGTRNIEFSAADRGPSGLYVPVVYGGGFKLAPKAVGTGQDLGKDIIVIGVPDYVPGNIMVIRDKGVACTHPDHIRISFSREHRAWVEEMSRGDVLLEERLGPMDFARLMVYLTTAY